MTQTSSENSGWGATAPPERTTTPQEGQQYSWTRIPSLRLLGSYRVHERGSKAFWPTLSQTPDTFYRKQEGRLSTRPTPSASSCHESRMGISRFRRSRWWGRRPLG